MSTLHIVNQTVASEAVKTCLSLALDGDSILLIEDGVYACSQLSKLDLKGLTLYALREDLLARGLSETALSDDIKMASYADFVDLVCSHQRSVSWT